MPPREVKTATIATDSFSGESKTKSRSNNEKFKIPLERIKELIENFGGRFVEFMDYISSFLGWEDSEVDKTVTLREQLDEIRQEIDRLGESSTSVDENVNYFEKNFDSYYTLKMLPNYSNTTFVAECGNIKDCIDAIFNDYLKGFTQDYLSTKNKLNNSHYTKSEIDTKINSINTSLLSVSSEQSDLLNNILINDKIYKEKDAELEESIDNLGMSLENQYTKSETDTLINDLSRQLDELNTAYKSIKSDVQKTIDEIGGFSGSGSTPPVGSIRYNIEELLYPGQVDLQNNIIGLMSRVSVIEGKITNLEEQNNN